ncbi:MAG: hypothetical protein H6711_20165 [Myxococcales bacterium]|nr:hypothetical protein [Myxococcales bacterium]
MPSTLQRWQDIYRIFDPIEPASAELRVARGLYNPLSEKIVPRLGLPLPHQKYVLAGGIGSGKSTELRATVEGLAGSKLVVLVDLWRHFESTVVDPGALDHLQPAELVGLLGLAILRTGNDLLGHDWRGLDKRLGSAIAGIRASSGDEGKGPALDVVALSKGIAVLVGGALAGPVGAITGGMVKAGVDGGLKLLEASTTWEWKVGLRDRKRTSDQDAPVRAVLQATNALLDDIRAHYKREIVLLVDGLDRIQEAATFEDLVVESSLLGELRCDLVATLQLGLVQRYRSRLHWCKPFDFTYVPIALQSDPTNPDPRGMNFFESLSAQRFKKLGIEAPIATEFIRQLAYHSGGRLRDFIALVREVAVQAMLGDAPTATREHIEEAVDQLRRDRESGLNAEHLRVLSEVLSDPQHRLPGGDIALNLLDRQLLLAYPNKSTWYLPHTILMPRLHGTAG